MRTFISLALACGVLLWGVPNAHAQEATPSGEAEKLLSREVYKSYVGNTLIVGFGADDFRQIWLHGDGTFSQYVNKVDQPITSPGELTWTGSSWWATGKEGSRSLCLQSAKGSPNCFALTPDRRPGDHWIEGGKDVVVLSKIAWTYPKPIPLSPPNNPGQYDPAALAAAEPSEADKATLRRIYADYVGNTLVCRFSGLGGCMLWLFDNGTFMVHMPPGYAPDPIDHPVAGRAGESWWAAGSDADRKLCLSHRRRPGQPRNYVVCYHLEPDHKPGDVWYETDDTMALLYGRN